MIIYHYYSVLRLRQRLLAVVQRLIEHNTLDNTKQLHQGSHWLEIQSAEHLFEVELVVAAAAVESR